MKKPQGPTYTKLCPDCHVPLTSQSYQKLQDLKLCPACQRPIQMGPAGGVRHQ